jgi:acyl carrier protein
MNQTINNKTEPAAIEEKVKTIIVKILSIDEKTITTQSNFVNDLGADSLDVVELIMEFEKAFQISIPDNEAEKIYTVSEAIAAIRKSIEYANLKSKQLKKRKT